MLVGVIAPPWVPVPPVSYGGIEQFVDLLALGLAEVGIRVRLFATGDSTCPVPRSSWFDAPPTPMGLGVLEAAQVAAAYDELRDCDLVHDNTTLGPLWAKAAGPRLPPVLMTCHNAVSGPLEPYYRRLGEWASLVAISHGHARTAASVPFAGIVHHGLDLSRFPVGDGTGGYALFLGRMAPEKGARQAVELARAAGVPLLLAAKVRDPEEHDYFATEVEPLLGGDVEFLGEVGHDEKVELLGGASALLNPIDWEEPFGLVMAEALACGTPVVATPRGAAPEIVEDGVTGFLVESRAQAVEALHRAGSLDRGVCRQRAEAHFGAGRMVDDYLGLYRQVLARAAA